MSQQFCLKWNNHMNNMMDVFKSLLSTEAMVDVTLACDGLSLKAHKIVLSACSPFFQSLFLENPCKHPIVILKDMKYTELKAIIEFMYHGEVNVAQDQLSALMKTAETLRVKGLAEVTNEKNSQSHSQEDSSHRSVPRTDTPPPHKRRRGRTRKRSLSDRSDDEASEPKIKTPDSDIEELSGDMDASSSQYSNLQSQVPMQTLSSSHNSFQKSQDQTLDQGAEESFAPEEKFGVEPSKLLEQTLTTDDLPRRSQSGRSSVQSNMEIQRRPRSSTDHHSTALVPTSVPSDALVSTNQQPDSPPDIKPELLDLDPPMSPMPGPSHSAPLSTDENSMMMYMDQSSMSGLPGPSGYQDNSALVSTDSQPQGKQVSEVKKLVVKKGLKQRSKVKRRVVKKGIKLRSKLSGKKKEPVRRYPKRKISKKSFKEDDSLSEDEFAYEIKQGSHQCDMCHRLFTSVDLLAKHLSKTHRKTCNKRHRCTKCVYSTYNIQSWRRHLLTQHQSKSYQCSTCNKSFSYYKDIRAHRRIHIPKKPIQNCNECGKKFVRFENLQSHKKAYSGKHYCCECCGQVFSTTSALRKHKLKRKHLIKKLYKCTQCKFSSSKLSALKVHRYTHKTKDCVQPLRKSVRGKKVSFEAPEVITLH